MLDDFTRQYLITALWAENDESTPSGGEPLDKNYTIEDFAPESIEQAIADCNAFREAAKTELAIALPLYKPLHGFTAESCAAHDFWLTRNEHGAGFWDGELGDVGDKLTEIAKRFGNCHPYVSDDGLIYFL